MPIYPCPECEKKLKAPDGAEGKKLRCPGCQTMLVITEDGLEVAGGSAVAAKPATKPAKKRADDDDEDDRPSKKKRRDDDDDDDDEPRSKKRKRDEDDDEDDDDERPRKKAARGRDDDEDDDDDDGDRRRKKKKKAGIPLWVWLASGGVGLVAIILILVLFVFSGGGSGFKKIKEGMTAKEVTDLLGQPTQGDTKFIAQWVHPKMEKLDPTKVKETLIVTFKDGKVSKTEIIDVAEMEKKLKGMLK